MWPRWTEILLGAALVLTSLLLDYSDVPLLRANAFACGIAVAAMALLSFSRAWRRAHLASVAVALWLGGVAYFTGGFPAAARSQAELVIALTLLMFAIIPSEASASPRSWREFGRRNAASRPPLS